MSYHIIIPMRYQSTRLPGKALLNITGKTMIEHVCDRAKQTSATSITVATDHQDIMSIARNSGVNVCMTRADHITGSDRLAEVLHKGQFNDNDIIVNVQGDEVCIAPENIDQVAQLCLDDPNAEVASLYDLIEDKAQLWDPNVVKVVMDEQDYALYFSRAPMSWERDNFANQASKELAFEHYHHIGLYAYRANTLLEYVTLIPTKIEQAERLEQLRFLSYGKKIKMAKALRLTPGGVDTSEDLARIEAFLKRHNKN